MDLDVTRGTLRCKEGSVANFIADAMRNIMKADIAWITAGSISSNRILPASITMGSLMMMFPWGGIFVCIKTPGRMILEACERSVSGLPNEYGYFAQVSGLTITYSSDCSVGKRIKSVSVGNSPLDLDKEYTVATTDFLAEGGDGYEMFKKATVVVSAEKGPQVIPTLSAYIRENCGGKVELKCSGRLKDEANSV